MYNVMCAQNYTGVSETLTVATFPSDVCGAQPPLADGTAVDPDAPSDTSALDFSYGPSTAD